METRLSQLGQLHSFVEEVDKDMTMILQTLHWDRKSLLSDLPMVTCRYNNDHRLPEEKLVQHENKCLVKFQGYSEYDEVLPDPLDNNANTLVKLDSQQITTILNEASRCNPMFKRGNNWENRSSEPWTLSHLQTTYTSDERRAIHDSVVQAVPSCHDLADLALPSSSKDEGATKVKSRVEILAELRDMRRRRTKYRQAAKTRNYSDVLRDVIKTQMESYSGTSQFTEQCRGNKSTQNDNANQSTSKDRETYFTNEKVREHPNKYHKSATRETNRFNSDSNDSYNSKRYANDRQQQSYRYDSYRHEKHRDRNNYKSNNTTRQKGFESEFRDKHTSSSLRYEHKEYRSNDSRKRNTKERQSRDSYRRKRNRESYTSDDSQDSRTTDREYRDRRKWRKNRRSPSYHDNHKRQERMHIKAERSKTPERHGSGKNQTLPTQRNSSSSELHTEIKKERNNSPDMTEKRDYANTYRPINEANIETSDSIKAVKTENETRYNHSRSESESPDYTQYRNREDNIQIKKENVSDTDKRIECGQLKSTSRIVQFERNSRRQHKESDDINRDYEIHVKDEYTGYTETNRRNILNIESRDDNMTRFQKHSHKRRSPIPTRDTSGHRDDGKDKYPREKYNYSDTGGSRRISDSSRNNKRSSYHDKDNARCDVRHTQSSHDERRKCYKDF